MAPQVSINIKYFPRCLASAFIQKNRPPLVGLHGALIVIFTLLSTSCGNNTQNTPALFSFRNAPTADPNGLMNGNVADSRSWSSPIVIDSSAVTATADPITTPAPFNTNVDSNNSYYTTSVDSPLNPLSVTIDSSDQPYVSMLAYDNYSTDDLFDSTWAAMSRIQSLVTTPYSYNTDNWPLSTSFNSYITVGAGSAFSSRPSVAVEYGTFHGDFHSTTNGAIHHFIGRFYSNTPTARLLVSRRESVTANINQSWLYAANPEDLTDLASAGTHGLDYDRTLDRQCIPRMASDAHGNTVVLWCSSDATDKFIYNIYRPGTGWSSLAALGSSGIVHLGNTYLPTNGSTLTSTDTPVGGIELAMNSDGNGWAVVPMRYAAGNDSVLLAYQFNIDSGFSATPVILDTAFGTDTHDGVALPKVWLRSDGSGHLFYYKNSNCAVTCLTSLYKIDLSTSGQWSAPTQFDDASVSESLLTHMTNGANNFESSLPVSLSSWGEYGVVTYVKPAVSGGSPRLFMSRYIPTTKTWTTPIAVDAIGGVGWATSSIGDSLISGSSGSRLPLILFSYEAASGGTGCYARALRYDKGGLTPEFSLASGYTATHCRPTAVVSNSGKAFVAYLATDAVAGVRRSLVSSYR